MTTGTVYDDPNRQCLGLDPIWTNAGDSGPEADPEPEADPLDAMTKDELLAVTADRGIDVPSSATKAEIRALIDG